MHTSTTDPNTVLGTMYAIIVMAAILLVWQRRRFYGLSRKFPGPLELPFLGILHRVSNPMTFLMRLNYTRQLYKSQTIFVFVGPQPILHTTDPVLLEKLLTATTLNYKPDLIYKPLKMLFGDGLFTADFDIWRKHRKVITPAFRLPVLNSFMEIFNKSSVVFKNKLHEMVGEQEPHLCDLVHKVTLTTAMDTMLGRKINNESEMVDDKIVEHYKNVLNGTYFAVFLNVIKLSVLAQTSRFYASRNAIFKFVSKLLHNRIASKRTATAQSEASPSMTTTTDDSDIEEERDKYAIFVDEVLQKYRSQYFSWQEVFDEASSLIFGAFETTGNSIYFTLVFLAMHPEVQDKLFAEIESIFPDKEFKVEQECISQAVYLDMVIKEALRLAPTVPIMARCVQQDLQLTDEIFLPKGLMIFFSIFGVHRDEVNWGPQASQFNPDNFLPENVAKRHPFTYMPFSKGARNCIGARYSMLFSKVFLIHTIRSFYFTTDFKYEDLQFWNHATLKLQQKPMLRIHKRDE